MFENTWYYCPFISCLEDTELHWDEQLNDTRPEENEIDLIEEISDNEIEGSEEGDDMSENNAEIAGKLMLHSQFNEETNRYFW